MPIMIVITTLGMVLGMYTLAEAQFKINCDLIRMGVKWLGSLEALEMEAKKRGYEFRPGDRERAKECLRK